MEIRVLDLQGMGIKTTARTLGVSRNNVRKYLRGEAEPPRYPARPPCPAELAPFKAYRQERVEAAGHTGLLPPYCYARSKLKAMQAASASLILPGAILTPMP